MSGRRVGRGARIALVVGVIVAVLAAGVPEADAWKPYTHKVGGDAVVADLSDDGTQAFSSFVAGAAGHNWTNAYLLSLLSQYVYLQGLDEVVDAAITEANFEEQFVDFASSELGLRNVNYIRNVLSDTEAVTVETADAVIIAFRGTETATPTELGDVVDAVIDGAIFNDGGIHRGFLTSAQSTIDEVRAAIGDASGKRVWLTGHSLGGAVAEVTAWLLEKGDTRVPVQGVVTYGAPRVFLEDTLITEDVAGAYDELFADRPTQRWVNNNDPVPHFMAGIPVVLPYRHIGQVNNIDAVPDADVDGDPGAACPATLDDEELSINANFAGPLADLTDAVLAGDAAAIADAATDLGAAAGALIDDHDGHRYAARIYRNLPANVRAVVPLPPYNPDPAKRAATACDGPLSGESGPEFEGGTLSIAGRNYDPPREVRDAIVAEPCAYNSGLIGPDGFPELVMGQSIIHPTKTGEWLELVLDRAWEAQSDPTRSAQEKRQILAFSYGFMTHAAGDMWAHTVVNEFAEGVFPGVTEIAEEPALALIALRHLIAEAYIGDATPGMDGNPAFDVFAGDHTDDSTPGICFDAPIDFIHDVLVDRDTAIPTGGESELGDRRGLLIDTFWGLRDQLQAWADSLPTFEGTLAAAAQAYEAAEDAVEVAEAALEAAKNALSNFTTDCITAFNLDRCGAVLGDLWDQANEAITVAIARVLATNFFNAAVTTAETALTTARNAVVAAASEALRAYLDAWIDDIDAGLRAWPELGLHMTHAMFDPQTRRDTQNDICGRAGYTEGTLLREECEKSVGLSDVMFEQSPNLDNVDDFVNEHLLPMLGLPDGFGLVRGLLGDAAAEFDALLAGLTGDLLNPINESGAAMKEAAQELLTGAIKATFGIDVDAIGDFLDSPASKMDVAEVPGLGSLFDAGDHEQLDTYMGLPPDHHDPDTVDIVNSFFGDVSASGPLADDVTFSESGFDPYENTVTLGKLLLLDGAELNEVVRDILVDAGWIHDGSTVATYRADDNIMIDGLDRLVGPLRVDDGDTWLLSIDGDHAWRANRRPTQAEPDEHLAGTGRMPLWESCVARPAFRVLFDDWENGASDFPDLGDDTSEDPTDRFPPTNELTIGGDSFTAPDGTVYVGASHTFTHRAHDNLFTDSRLTLEHRWHQGTPGDWVASRRRSVARFGLPSDVDGTWTLETRTSDPCGNTLGVTSTTVVLDTTAPVVATGGPYVTPEGVAVTLDGSGTTDAGSGVAATGWSSVDPLLFSQGDDPVEFVPADNGVYQMTLTATDRVGNTAAAPTTVSVTNQAPTVDAGAGQAADEGDIVQLAGAAFNDPGTLDSHTATVDWGDGTGPQPAAVTEVPVGPPGSTAGLDGTVTSSHVYADDGSYTVTVCVTDDDDGQACDTAAVTVANAAPTASVGQLGEGADFLLPFVDSPLAGGFNDPGTLDTHTAMVDWGDGTAAQSAAVTETPFGPPGSTAGLDGTVAAGHAYSSAGNYVVTLTVVDDDGGSDSATAAIEVVSPAEAVRRMVARLESMASDPDIDPAARVAIGEALKDLDGPDSAPNSGALDKLVDGDEEAGLLKILAAFADLDAAEAADPSIDLGLVRLVLAQVAESVAGESLDAARTAVEPPSKGERKQLDALSTLFAAGRQHRLAARWIDAVEAFYEVTRGANALAR